MNRCQIDYKRRVKNFLLKSNAYLACSPYDLFRCKKLCNFFNALNSIDKKEKKIEKMEILENDFQRKSKFLS